MRSLLLYTLAVWNEADACWRFEVSDRSLDVVLDRAVDLFGPQRHRVCRAFSSDDGEAGIEAALQRLVPASADVVVPVPPAGDDLGLVARADARFGLRFVDDVEVRRV